MSDELKPLVSVLIPLYNQKRYFGACMRSVCQQTYKNLEIIIVNDGSTDSSPQMAKDWAEKDKRVILINKKNEGASKARYDAYKRASGDFIFGLDSDDYIPHNAIELLVGHMVSKNVDLVIGSMTQSIGFIKRHHYYDGGSFPFHQVVKQPELFDKYYLNFFGMGYFSIMTAGSLFRKSSIDRAMRYTRLCCDEIPFVGEDHYAFMKLFPFLRSMYRTDETTYYYRCGGGSSDRFSPTYPSLFFLSDERLKLLDRYHLQDGYRPLFVEYANTVFYHAQQLLEFKQTDKDGVISFLKNELDTRAIVKRMREYFSGTEVDNPKLQLMLDSDFEGIYKFVVEGISSRTITQKLKKLIMRIISI